MYMRFPGGKYKAVTLSYDDGFVFDKQLIEIMNRYGLKGTFNINSGLYFPEDEDCSEHNRRMKLSEAKELYLNSGHEIATHTFTHTFMTDIDDVEKIEQISKDRRNLEKDFSVIVRGGAYPNGRYNSDVIQILKSCGICYFRTSKSTEQFSMPDNWLAIQSTCRHSNPKLMELAKRFIEREIHNWGPCKMFYLWGHSYEFNNDNNWHIIEDFAKYIGRREDIWYATNIEIYDYTEAYNRLHTSWDKKTIHNPSAIDVWVYINNDVIVIPAGQTVAI